MQLYEGRHEDVEAQQEKVQYMSSTKVISIKGEIKESKSTDVATRKGTAVKKMNPQIQQLDKSKKAIFAKKPKTILDDTHIKKKCTSDYSNHMAIKEKSNKRFFEKGFDLDET